MKVLIARFACDESGATAVEYGLIAAAMAQRSLKRLPRHEHKHKLDLLGAGLMTAEIGRAHV